jgi:hypothetical protein
MRTATKLLKLWPYRTLIVYTLQPGDPVTFQVLSVWTQKNKYRSTSYPCLTRGVPLLDVKIGV